MFPSVDSVSSKFWRCVICVKTPTFGHPPSYGPLMLFRYPPPGFSLKHVKNISRAIQSISLKCQAAKLECMLCDKISCGGPCFWHRIGVWGFHPFMAGSWLEWLYVCLNWQKNRYTCGKIATFQSQLREERQICRISGEFDVRRGEFGAFDGTSCKVNVKSCVPPSVQR